MPELLNMTKAAKFLGITRPTLYGIINNEESKIPYYIVGPGKRKMFDPDKLKEWKEETNNYISMKELSELTGMHRKTLWDWRKLGMPYRVHYSGVIKYDKEETMNWILNKD